MRKLGRSAVVCAFAIALAIAVPVASAKECSLQNVAGSYGYHFTGFVSPSTGLFLPAAGAGSITFDGHGNVSGKQTRVVAGSALDETYTGTYTVNPDCSGAFAVLVQPDTRTSTVRLVWTNDTNNVSAVFTTAGFTLAAEATRISEKD